MAAGGSPWITAASGLRLRIRLQPRASKDAVEGIEPTAEGPAVKARVRAVPEDGKANAAAERLIADWLGVPPSHVTVVAGHKSRVKTLAIEGASTALAEKVGARLAGARPATVKEQKP